MKIIECLSQIAMISIDPISNFLFEETASSKLFIKNIIFIMINSD